MNKLLIIAGIIAIIFVAIFLHGDQRVKAKETIIERITKEENNSMQLLAYLPYHGGFPPIPKPQKLNVAITDNDLLLFTNEGISGKISFDKCKKVEKFTTRKNADLKGKSIVLWGPLIGIFLKPKIRHFLVVNYQDLQQKRNNLLLETSNTIEQNQVYEKIFLAFNQASNPKI